MLLLPSGPVPLLLPSRALFRAFSYGGGVQSNAVLVLAAQKRIYYDVFIFANVGADSENPATLEYIEKWAKPYAKAHGIELVEVARIKDGERFTLKQKIYWDRGVPIPARMGGNGMPGKRGCTEDWKINVVGKYIDTLSVPYVVQGLGISLDEFSRARTTEWYKQNHFMQRREYPLINMRLSRSDCLRIVQEAGLPEPPKSSCFFCPFHKRSEWIEMKREQPDLFQQAVEIEKHMNEKVGKTGREAFYLHPSLMPLDQAVGDQLPLWADETLDACETGYCMV